MEADPFPNFKISSSAFLDESEGRSLCPKCGKSRKYYCYTCYVPVTGLEDKVPKVKLPVKIDIIKHPNECDGKSTAAHAGVLAPDHVNVYNYPVIPDYSDRKRVVLVFPGETSISLEDLAKEYGVNIQDRNHRNDEQQDKVQTNSEQDSNNSVTKNDHSHKSEQKLEGTDLEEKSDESGKQSVDVNKDSGSNGRDAGTTDSNNRTSIGETSRKRPGGDSAAVESACTKKARTDDPDLPFDTVIFIDSTWNQTKKIYLDERLRGLRQVELKVQETKFWRHQQDKPRTYLATIEAIYYFLRQFHEYFMPSSYDGEYDNILFFFSFMYHKIRHLYEGGKKLKAYQQQKKDNESSSKTSQ